MTLAQIIGDYDNPQSLGSKFRQKRARPLQQMIADVFREKGRVNILDVGGMEYYWNIIPQDFLLAHRVNIVLSNLPDDIRPVDRPDIFAAHEGDGCHLPYQDNEFDICHSNSVIEHVGNWARKAAYAAEVGRVAQRQWHQTPNFWFPWEPHFGFPVYHWLPEPMRLGLACRRKLGWSPKAANITQGMHTVEYASLLDKRMFVYLFPSAEILTERFLGLTKSFIAVRR